jgi:glyoxylase-like metal-dependent hydrolase (beta-lactamase superfamily II)
MRSYRYSSFVAAIVALGTFSAASNVTAQQVELPMGRAIGDACTRSVAVPEQPQPQAQAQAQGQGQGRGSGGRAGFPPPPVASATAESPAQLVSVTEDVYAVINVNDTVLDIGAYGGNVAIYLTDDGVVLVDSKNESMHADLMAKVQSLTDLPIRYVVLTHNHADHSGGAASLQALGATVVLTEANRERMTAAGQSPLPQIAYNGHAEIVLGRKRAQLLEFCGHTSGDTVVYLPDARVVVVGDLVTTPDSIPQIVNYADGGNWTDLVGTLDALSRLDFDFMIAGHGPVLTKQEFLVRRDRIAAIRARAEELARDGRSVDEIAQTLTTELNWGSGFAASNIPGMIAEFD